MSCHLNLDQLPLFCYSAFKYFTEGEKHVTRYCEQDVLILMISGTLYFSENGSPVSLSKGQYYIQKSGLFQEGIIPSSDAVYYFVHFHGNFSKSKNGLPLSGKAYFTGTYDGFEKLNFMQRTGASEVEKNAEFYHILSRLKSESEVTQNRKIVLQTISLITEDYQKIYTLEQLAAFCGFSKNYLIRVFKQETGQTPFSYITGLRLQEAKKLLTNSDMPIGEISEKCGFGSYINFYKAFTSQNEITPEKWRRQTRGLAE